MSASKEIKDLYATVKDLLQRFPLFRDDERKLCTMIWKIESEQCKMDLTKTTAYEFLSAYRSEKTFSSADSITRTSRMVKKEFQSLEGDKQTRLEEVPKVKQTLKQIA